MQQQTTAASQPVAGLQAIDLCCMRGARRLFRGLSLSLQAGQALRVQGANGSGKTTLLRTLAGLSTPAQGQILWQGQPLARCREAYAASMLYLGHAAALSDDLLAWENLVYGARLHGHGLSRDAALQLLAAQGLGRVAQLPARLLSQGQRKRLALARLHDGAARTLWLLDEPLNALDQPAVQALCASARAHLAGGGMLVYTSHQELALADAATLTLAQPGAGVAA